MPAPLIGSCVIAQSGGPSSVINASAYGVIDTALNSPHIENVYAAAHGIVGVLTDTFYDMGKEDPAELKLLLNTPASALGSCRYKMADPDKDDTDYKRIQEIFEKYNIRYFFYNGGNDSMDTCEKISRYFAKTGYECRVMGVPKTIDNDLFGTDHCPGFGSAARYVATSFMEVYQDTSVYDIGQITIIEVMGRHAGWLTASAALASHFGAGPDLIYVPEVAFDLDAFLDDVTAIYEKNKRVLVAVSEGIHDADGKLIVDYGARITNESDAFGHTQLGGLAAILASMVRTRTSAKVRGIELSLLQRCAAHVASQTDIDEAFLAGKVATESALAGESGKMVAFTRDTSSGAYVCNTTLIPLADVANREQKLPLEWITPTKDGVTSAFIDYALPLIQGEPTRTFEGSLPRFAKLKKVRV